MNTKTIDASRRRLFPIVGDRVPDLPVLMRTERSPEFEQLCMRRKIMGAMRYGLFGVPGKAKWNRIDNMIQRLEAYRKDRNSEHLVDVANLAELEFAEGENDFTAQAEHTVHTREE